MKQKFALFTILLTLSLLSVACAEQDATNEPGGVTTVATVSTDGGTATQSAGEASMTPTGSVEGGTPTSEAGETNMTPTISAESGTPAQGANGTAVIPQTGPGDAGIPDDLDEVLRVLRETGATVEFGDAVELDFLSVPGQTIRINGEEVQIFTFPSAEELEIQAAQIADDGNPEDEPHFYKLGSMLIRYLGNNPGVRDLLEDVLGAQAAGQ